MVMMAMLVLLSVPLLTACNSKENISIHSISDIYIPDDVFVCAEKPIKPEKSYDPIKKVMTYKESDVSFLLEETEAARADCKNQLGVAREIYKKQKEGLEK